MNSGSFEINKIAGAALSALLFIFGAKELQHILAHGEKTKVGYELPAPTGGSGGGGAPAQAWSPAAVLAALPTASVDGGKEVYKACVQCHRTGKGEASPQGPNLHGIIGREIGKYPGFTNYSPVMQTKGGNWTYEALAAYLHDPRGNIPGNRMAFAGVKDDKDMADLLAFLRTQADTPAPLPK